VQTKYSTWDWNFGNSPAYNFRKVIRTENSGTLEFCMYVNNGVIKQARIYGDYFSHADPGEIESALTDILHEEEAIRKAVAQFEISDYFGKLTVDEFVKGWF
jgi:lipoate-protein ligase A